MFRRTGDIEEDFANVERRIDKALERVEPLLTYIAVLHPMHSIWDILGVRVSRINTMLIGLGKTCSTCAWSEADFQVLKTTMITNVGFPRKCLCLADDAAAYPPDAYSDTYFNMYYDVADGWSKDREVYLRLVQMMIEVEVALFDRPIIYENRQYHHPVDVQDGHVTLTWSDAVVTQAVEDALRASGITESSLTFTIEDLATIRAKSWYDLEVLVNTFKASRP